MPSREVAWGLFISLLTLYVVYRVPANLVEGVGTGFRLEILDWLTVCAFIADPVLGLFIARERGKHAFRSFLRYTLPVDCISVVGLVAFPASDPLCMLALLKLLNVTQFVTRWRHQLLRRGSLIRMLLFAYWLLVLIHVTACGWLAIRFNPPVSADSGEYLKAVYWSVTTLTTIGYGDITPQNPSEMQYAIVVMLVGFLMMGYLIGNISGLLNKPDPLRAQYASALEEVSAFATYHGLPAEIKHRIVDYFGYMWQQRASFNESNVLDALPGGIKTEIMLHLKRDVIQQVPFFRDASEVFIREIANEMRPIVVTPGEFVFHSGDPALHMYFIGRGTLEVIDEKGHIVGSLNDGDFFGEMALLEHRRRMASVRALDYCDLYKLESQAFHRILDAHPDFREYMEGVVAARTATGGQQQRSTKRESL